MKNCVKSLFAVLALVFVSLNTGCMKPYQTPVFKEVAPHETAFVVPLDGDSTKQDSFASAKFLLTRKVATKRIEIPTRWVQTARGGWNGEWKPTLMVITVNRTPVTCTFTADTNTGTSKRNQALYAESKDSIGVSSGFSLTALVQEEDTHIFLYKFKGDSLKDVVDSQVFNSVQAVYTEICSKYDLKELRAKKQEITDKIRTSVIPMYKEWGITINPDMGLVGGFLYEDKEIQGAINAVFVNQTKKEANEALRDAQKALNEQQMSAKQNAAAMVLVDREAEAQGILMVAKAMNEAGAMYIQNKQLEVMANAITKWDGALSMVNGGGQMPLLFNMPLPESSAKAAAVASK